MSWLLHRRYARGSHGAIASGTHFIAIGARIRDISFFRQIAPIGWQAESSGRCWGDIAPIDKMVKSSGWPGCCIPDHLIFVILPVREHGKIDNIGYLPLFLPLQSVAGFLLQTAPPPHGQRPLLPAPGGNGNAVDFFVIGMVQAWVVQKTRKRDILRVFTMSDFENI
jgi:hypothetical protein